MRGGIARGYGPGMADETTAQRVGGNVRAELARNRVTQHELGGAIGMGQPALSLRLSGQREFRASELDRIAQYLRVPVSTLIGERGGDAS